MDDASEENGEGEQEETEGSSQEEEEDGESQSELGNRKKRGKRKKSQPSQQDLSMIEEENEGDDPFGDANKGMSALYTPDEMMDRETRRLERSRCCLGEMCEVYSKLTDPIGTRKQLLKLLQGQPEVTTQALADIDSIIEEAAIQGTQKDQLEEYGVSSGEDGAEADDEMDYVSVKGSSTGQKPTDNESNADESGVGQPVGLSNDGNSFQGDVLSVVQSGRINSEDFSDVASGQGDGPVDPSGQRRLYGLRKKFRLFQLTMELMKEAAWAPFLRIEWPRVLDESDGRRHLLQAVKAQVKEIALTDTRETSISVSKNCKYTSNKNFEQEPPPVVKVWTQTAESGSVVIMGDNKPHNIQLTMKATQSGANRALGDDLSKANKTDDANELFTSKTDDINILGTDKTIDINKSGTDKTIDIDKAGSSRIVDINKSGTDNMIDNNIISGTDKSVDAKNSDMGETVVTNRSDTNKAFDKTKGIVNDKLDTSQTEMQMTESIPPSATTILKTIQPSLIKKTESDGDSSEDDEDIDGKAFDIWKIPYDNDGNPVGKSTGICHYCGQEILPFPTPYQRFKAWDAKQFYCCEQYQKMFEEIEVLDVNLGKASQSKQIDITPHSPYRSRKWFPGFGPCKRHKIFPGSLFFDPIDIKKKKKKERSSLTSGGDVILPDIGTTPGRPTITDRQSNVSADPPTDRSTITRVSVVSPSEKSGDTASVSTTQRRTYQERQSSQAKPRAGSIASESSPRHKVSVKEKEGKPKQRQDTKKNNAKASMFNRATMKPKGPTQTIGVDTSDLFWDPYEVRFGHPRFFDEDSFDEPTDQCYRHAFIVLTQTELYDFIESAQLSGPGPEVEDK